MPLRLEVVRTFADVERVADLWDAVPWQREEAERSYFVARTQARPEAVAPFALIARDGGAVAGALAGRIDVRRLPASLGYRTLYAPRVRLLHVLDGGLWLPRRDTLEAVVAAVDGELRRRAFDAVVLPHLPVDSPVLEAFERRAGPARRQRRSRPQPRWRLPLPETFEQFLASRSANTRWRLRRDARRIADAFGGRVELAVVRDPGGLDRLLGDAERVARSTYQRALGTGFAVTPERREATRVGLEHGWTRGYLLYARGEPVAFWICSVYRGTLLVRLTGYDDRYAGLRVGIHLLARVIEDAIRDPAIAVVDFGPGDAAYKRQLAAESHLERDLVVFAPTLRGVRINAGRNAVLLAADGARRALDAARLTDRVRTGWRLRLRR